MPDEIGIPNRFIFELTKKATETRRKLTETVQQRESTIAQVEELEQATRAWYEDPQKLLQSIFNPTQGLFFGVQKEFIQNAPAKREQLNQVSLELSQLTLEQQRLEAKLDALAVIQQEGFKVDSEVKSWDALKALMGPATDMFSQEDMEELRSVFDLRTPEIEETTMLGPEGEPLPDMLGLTDEQKQAVLDRLSQKYGRQVVLEEEDMRPQVNITWVEGIIDPSKVRVVITQDELRKVIRGGELTIEVVSNPAYSDFAWHLGRTAKDITDVLKKITKDKATKPEMEKALEFTKQNIQAVEKVIKDLEDEGKLKEATKMRQVLKAYDNIEDFLKKATTYDIQVQKVKDVTPTSEYDISAGTVEAIVKAMSLDVEPTPEVPDGTMSRTDLIRLFGEDAITLKNDNIVELVMDMREKAQVSEAIRTGMSAFEVPPLSMLERVVLVVQQPAFAVFEFMQMLSEYVTKPWSGMIVTNVARLVSPKKTAFERIYNEAKEDGLNWWLAYGETHDIERHKAIYEEETGEKLTTAQFGTRFGGMLAAEIFLDPTTYLGWRAVSNVATHFGPVGMTLAKMNNGWIKFTDEATLAVIGAIKRRAPKTQAQMITAQVESVLHDARTTIARELKDPNMANWLPEQVTEIAKKMRETVMSVPDMAKAGAPGRFGKSQLFHRPIEIDEIGELLKRVGVDDIPDNFKMLEINTAFEEMKFMNPVGGFTGDKTAIRVLNLLDAETSTKNISTIRKYLERRLRDELKGVEAIFQDNDVTRIFNNFESFLHSRLKAHYNSKVTAVGIVSSKVSNFLNNVNDMTNAGVIGWIDKQINIPLSRFVLVFPAYGVANAGEVWMKSAMRGYNILPDAFAGNSPVRLAQWIMTDIGNGPADIMGAVIRQEGTLTTEAGDTFLRKGAGDFAPVLQKAYNWTWGLGRKIPGWKKIVPKSLSCAEAWQETTAEWQLRGRASYLNQEYMSQLSALDPKRAKLAKKMAKQIHNQGIKGMTHGQLREIEQFVEAAMMSSPDHVRSLKKNLTQLQRTKVAMAYDEAAGLHPTIPDNVHNYIKHEIVEGSGLTRIDDVIDRAAGRIADDAILSTLYKSKGVAELIEAEVQHEIKTAADFEAAVKLYQDMSNNTLLDVSELHQMVTRRGHQITDSATKAEFHDEALGRLFKFMDDTRDALERLSEKIKAVDVDSIYPGRGQQFTNLTDIYDNITSNIRYTRARQQEIFNATLGKYKGHRSNAFWKEVYGEMDELWDNLREMNRGLIQQRDKMMLEMAGLRAPRMSQVPDNFTVAHVARALDVDINNLAGSIVRGEHHTMMSKADWSDMIQARLQAMAEHSGTTLEAAGYSRAGIERCYDDILRSMSIEPGSEHTLSTAMMELDDIRMQVKTISASVSLTADDAARYNRFLDHMAEVSEKQSAFSIAEREAAMEAARKQYSIDFADYTNQNVFDAIIKKMYPFWTYETHRLQWIPRALIQKPVLLKLYRAYMESTERGRIAIPGTDWSVNPLVGTIFMGGFRRLFVKDRPEYWDRFPMMTQILDYGSRWGFYPGPFMNIALSMVGTAEVRFPQFGEILPPLVQTPIDAFIAANPDSELADALADSLLPSTYRDYINVLDLNSRNMNGDLIWAKKRQGIELTAEEKRAWDRAESRTHWFRVANAMAGSIFAYTPEKRRQIYENSSKLIENVKGVTVDQQEQLRNYSAATEKTLGYYLPMTPMEEKLIMELSGLKTLSGLYSPLLPSTQQEVRSNIELYYDETTKYYDSAKQGGGKLPEDKLPQTEIDRRLQNYFAGKTEERIHPDRWISSTYELKNWAATASDILMNDPRYKNLPLTLLDVVDDEGNVVRQGRVNYYKENNIPYFYHPMKELLWHYRQITPEGHEDPDLGWSTDWDKYFQETRSLINAVPPENRQEFYDNMQMHMTDWERLFWVTNEAYIRPYKNVRDEALQGYTPEQQSIIKRVPVATPEEREELKGVMDVSKSRIMVITPYEEALLSTLMNIPEMQTRQFVVLEDNAAVSDFMQQLDENEKDNYTPLSRGQKRSLEQTDFGSFLKELTDDERKLYAQFDSKVRQIRKNLRGLDPELDAWLVVWGVVDTPATAEGERVYKSIAKDLGAGRLDSYVADMFRFTIYGTREEK